MILYAKYKCVCVCVCVCVCDATIKGLYYEMFHANSRDNYSSFPSTDK